MSQFYYGSNTHPDSEVNFAGIQRQIEYSPTQRANILHESWSMRGKIIATGQAAIMTALAARRSWYSTNGQSAGFAGTPFVLDTNNSVGGVIVTNPVSHGPIEGAGWTNFLNYTFGLKADTFLSATNTLLSYSEQLAFTDNFGLPLQIGRLPVLGPPIIQNVTTASFFYATQSGQLTMRTPNPSPEQMIWPELLIGDPDSRQISFFSPKTERGVPIEYGVRWSYKYRSITPFFGSVHTRG